MGTLRKFSSTTFDNISSSFTVMWMAGNLSPASMIVRVFWLESITFQF